MSYLAVVSRQIGDTSDGFEYAGVDENGVTVSEPWDGEMIGPFHAKGIEICNNKKIGYMLTYIDDINLEVYVTSSRVLVRCDKYDKGSRKWSGGLTALALNAVERGIGKARSKGKTFIGHIRYEWIVKIMYENKTGFFLFDNMVRLVYQDEDEYPFKSVTLKFKKDTDTVALANLILNKTCLYRKAMTDEKDEETIEILEKYADPANKIEKAQAANKYDSVLIPGGYIAPYGDEFRPLLDGVVLQQDKKNVNEQSLPEKVQEDVQKKEISEADTERTIPLLTIRCLIVRPSTGEEIIVDEDTFTIGRSQKRCDYVIPEPSVSNAHAQILRLDGGFYIKDLDSSNHTYVNGEIIDGTPAKLKDGDLVRFAKEEFKIKIG